VKVVTKNEGRISPQGLSSLVVPKSDALRIRNEGGIFLGGFDSSSGCIIDEGQRYVWGIL
jgi:hypothetical protein